MSKNLSTTSLLSLSTVAGVLLASLIGCGTETSLTSGLLTQGEKGGNPSSISSAEESTSKASLADQLIERAAVSAAKFPEEIKSKFKAGIDTVRESGIEKSAMQVGDKAADAELIGWNGKTVRLSDLWNEGPIVLMWYRGGWCPYCNIQLRAMQQSLDQIENAGARLVVLTPEIPEKAKETAEANNLEMVALHDRDSQLAKTYGIMFDLPEPIVPIYRNKLKLPSYNGSNKMQLPLAATYVINTSGEITYAFLDADYRKRAEPVEVVEAVKAAAK